MRSLLEDDASKIILDEQIALRKTHDYTNLSLPGTINQYFTTDLLFFSSPNWKEEVFCDIGAYNGDTFLDIQKRSHHQLKHFIVFEPDNENFQKLSYHANSSKTSNQIFKYGTWEIDKGGF